MSRLEILRKVARIIMRFSLVLFVVTAGIQVLLPEVFKANPQIGVVAYYAITISIALLIGVNGMMILAIHKERHKK